MSLLTESRKATTQHPTTGHFLSAASRAGGNVLGLVCLSVSLSVSETNLWTFAKFVADIIYILH